jgi:hypothetical protein
MGKRDTCLGFMCILVVAIGVGAFLLHSREIAEMRKRSSFVTIADGSVSFKKCLDRYGIENRFSNSEIEVREVDVNQAIEMCS